MPQPAFTQLNRLHEDPIDELETDFMTINKHVYFASSFAAGTILCLLLFSHAASVVEGKKVKNTFGPPHSSLEKVSVPAHIDSEADNIGEPSQSTFKTDEWRPGNPHPVEPENTTLPPSGKATLRSLLGWKEEWHIHNSVSGFIPNPTEVTYIKAAGKTRLTFSSGWAIEVDDKTGSIIVPSGLPTISDEALVDMTWRALVANEGLERYRKAYRRKAEDGTVIRELVDVRLDEIRRVGDKAFVAWKLVESPPPDEDGFIRPVFWIDVRTGKIVHQGMEIHEDR